MGYSIRKAKESEFKYIGQLMVDVYSNLEGFVKPEEHPHYYHMLANVGDLTANKEIELLVGVDERDAVAGAVVLFYDMQYYGSGGMAIEEKNSAGFRLLAVDPLHQGKGVGKLLVEACVQRAKARGLSQVIIHTTLAMKKAWEMYERMGFQRYEALDFAQGDLRVFSLRLPL